MAVRGDPYLEDEIEVKIMRGKTKGDKGGFGYRLKSGIKNGIWV